MNILRLFTLGLLLSPFTGYTQEMNINTYRDVSLPFIENNTAKYNFIYPVCSDALNSPTYYPNATDLYYLKATYGSRYLSSTTTKSDNHGGLDFWHTVKCDNIAYGSSNLYKIVSMCDGVISEVLHDTDAVLENTSKGRSVQVTCDSTYQSLSGNIIINYRHMDSIWTKPWTAWNTNSTTDRIDKGDTIGIVGSSGFTSNIHLHLSAEGNHPDYGQTNVSTYRLFNPNESPGVIEHLDYAKIALLHHWVDSALFRITWPFNQSINRFAFINGGFSAVFDAENAYSQGASTRDNHDVLTNLDIYSYQFNGKRSAKYRYDNEKNNIPAEYPASPQRDTNLTLWGYAHIPITHDSIAYVYDFMVKNLPVNYDETDFVVKLSDVWGYTVEGNLPPALPLNFVSLELNILKNGHVSISWKTAQEINNDYFTVERSHDGVHWKNLAFVDAATSNTSKNNYQYIDDMPLINTSFYRIRQTDFDGHNSYSKIESIVLTDYFPVIIYPNPSTKKVIIEATEISLANLKIFNTLGDELTPFVNVSILSTTTVELNIINLPKGIYFIKIDAVVYKMYKN